VLSDGKEPTFRTLCTVRQRQQFKTLRFSLEDKDKKESARSTDLSFWKRDLDLK
jgi:hypothetical protein